MTGDVEKMIAVGLVWGATNALMRRGALIWDQAIKNSSPPRGQVRLHRKLLASLKNWLTLLFVWQYSVPFLLNLCASATFFAILSNSPISLAVPVTNATTFAATALFGMLLGEKTRVGFSLLVVIDHVVVLHPLQLTHLGITQLAVHGGGAPVGLGFGGTLINAGWTIPLASSCPELAESCYERCAVPVELNKPTSNCPVISIPYAGVYTHPLLVRVGSLLTLIVTENMTW